MSIYDTKDFEQNTGAVDKPCSSCGTLTACWPDDNPTCLNCYAEQNDKRGDEDE